MIPEGVAEIARQGLTAFRRLVGATIHGIGELPKPLDRLRPDLASAQDDVDTLKEHPESYA